MSWQPTQLAATNTPQTSRGKLCSGSGSSFVCCWTWAIYVFRGSTLFDILARHCPPEPTTSRNHFAHQLRRSRSTVRRRRDVNSADKQSPSSPATPGTAIPQPPKTNPPTTYHTFGSTSPSVIFQDASIKSPSHTRAPQDTFYYQQDAASESLPLGITSATSRGRGFALVEGCEGAVAGRFGAECEEERELADSVKTEECVF